MNRMRSEEEQREAELMTEEDGNGNKEGKE